MAAVSWWLALGLSVAGTVSLPPRPTGARSGKAVAASVADFGLVEREAVLRQEILSGNVPEFWRHFTEVAVEEAGQRVVFHVAPDYLMVGQEADFFRTPLTPGSAEIIARRLRCTLPTRKMVDAIYRTAAVKLAPQPRPPEPGMTTVPAFLAYQETVRAQRAETLTDFPFGALTAGHQKDIVRTTQLPDHSGKVAIYGWHRPDGTPIQPLYTGHAETWVDYSHGVRLVAEAATLNGQPSTITEILTNPKTATLLSDESRPAAVTERKEVERAAAFGETLTTLEPERGIRLVLNRPAAGDPARPVRLIVYALPNGNTIEQTMGHQPAPGEDWRFGIQHIAAQTRWLREHRPETCWMTAYVECAEKSWPAWCRKHADSGPRIAALMDRLRREVTAPSIRMTLTGHSGGGAFNFRYLDSAERIPDDVERIAFLDSNYAYDAAKNHAGKLSAWLAGAPDRFLTVIAYHDSIALLNGKTFVSEKGGTWGRSHAMLDDLGHDFPFSKATDGPLQTRMALEGRVTFLLMENPEKAVLHTRLVERNGFLHALLSGTPPAGKGYRFFGDICYGNWISGF